MSIGVRKHKANAVLYTPNCSQVSIQPYKLTWEAIHHALEMVNKWIIDEGISYDRLPTIFVFTDSYTAAKCILKYGYSEKYSRVCQRVKELFRMLKVILVKVKSHVKVTVDGNLLADELANIARLFSNEHITSCRDEFFTEHLHFNYTTVDDEYFAYTDTEDDDDIDNNK